MYDTVVSVHVLHVLTERKRERETVKITEREKEREIELLPVRKLLLYYYDDYTMFH